ncbi:hypothetical protein DFQ27_006037 [Actinomortierella ambigua]|uniref:Uncharacterized protein n=1 Tax=Actinomortierella ambigua TaxID=1343610 RepID=A0A9P6U228_9FUNG|nr:hypothetical protein DFQ27_006037 [Actinomortierella ambigua]
MQMFLDRNRTLSESEEYMFRAEFEKCEPALATLYKHPPRLSTKYCVARGNDIVGSCSVDIQDGEVKRECVVTPGWECVFKLPLFDANGCKVIRKCIRNSTFFPAAK